MLADLVRQIVFNFYYDDMLSTLSSALSCLKFLYFLISGKCTMFFILITDICSDKTLCLPAVHKVVIWKEQI